MNKTVRLVSTVLIFLLALSACNLPSSAPEQTDTAATTVAQTVQAELTQSAPPTASTTPLVLPAITTVAPPTISVPPTVVILPTVTTSCDISQFITDVTVPDGTIMTPGQTFTKTWRFRNAGSCSWTPSYAIVFSSGDSMNGPATQALVGNVNPGQTVDISVNLTAPTAPGDYKGWWKLRNAAGVLFAQFYVQIKVQNTSTVTPPIAQVVLNAVGGESGTVYEAAAGQGIPSTILAGDTSTNFLARGFMSFDISSLTGKTINSASLNLSSCSQAQNPFTSLSGIWVGELQYALPLDQSDYDLAGTGVQLLNGMPGSSIDVKSYVQARITEGKARFQIRLHPAGPSDGYGQSDYISCNASSGKLTVVYQP